MASTTTMILIGIFISVAVGYFTFVCLLDPQYDPREPPVLSHYIPYVGHIIGMIQHGQGYFDMLRFVLHHFATPYKLYKHLLFPSPSRMRLSMARESGTEPLPGWYLSW